ncbi:MAG: Uma2 family endonuclease [Bryobacteraceae bacterium]
MATANKTLSLEEFRTHYGGRKPHFEYWFGEAVQKPMPTWLHAVLQGILIEFLKRAGYKAGSELELRIDPDWRPVPDVAGLSESPETSYPTRPVDIVIEVLSPDDDLGRVTEKCRQYARIGILKIFLADPVERKAWEWKRSTQQRELVDVFALPNGRSIALADVWDELAKQL